MRVVQEVAAEWEKLALHLQFPHSVIQIIKTDHRYCEACSRELFRRWLEGEAELKEVTWKGLDESSS